jgi:hypothetical protein
MYSCGYIPHDAVNIKTVPEGIRDPIGSRTADRNLSLKHIDGKARRKAKLCNFRFFRR